MELSRTRHPALADAESDRDTLGSASVINSDDLAADRHSIPWHTDRAPLAARGSNELKPIHDGSWLSGSRTKPEARHREASAIGA